MAGVMMHLEVPRAFTDVHRVPRQVAKGAESAFRAYMGRAEARAKRLVSGPVLKRRSGKLHRSIRATVFRQGSVLVGRLGSDVIYAAIHEFGGTIPAHIVRPRRARVLRFVVNGKVVYAAFARIPTIRMPERPYLRRALREELPAFLADLEAVLRQVAAA